MIGPTCDFVTVQHGVIPNSYKGRCVHASVACIGCVEQSGIAVRLQQTGKSGYTFFARLGAGVAQLVRALDCGSRGRGFEPHPRYHTERVVSIRVSTTRFFLRPVASQAGISCCLIQKSTRNSIFDLVALLRLSWRLVWTINLWFHETCADDMAIPQIQDALAHRMSENTRWETIQGEETSN